MAATFNRTFFEEHDPNAKTRGDETRFLCPFPDCAEHQRGKDRSLCYRKNNGLWHCHRCDAKGQDPAFWKQQPGTESGKPKTNRERAKERLKKAFAVPTPKPVAIAPEESPEQWRKCLGEIKPLKDTHGAVYLERRGLPTDLCHECGVRFDRFYYGRHQAVVFPLRGPDGKTVAVQGRLIEPPSGCTSKLTSRGGMNSGLFITPGALDSPILCIVEAPINAITLHLCGLPAVATCGAGNLPSRLKRHALNKVVLIASDNDLAGEKAFAAAVQFFALSAPLSVKRFHPDGDKKGFDFNDQLMRDGAPALREYIARLLQQCAPSFILPDLPKEIQEPVSGHSKTGISLKEEYRIPVASNYGVSNAVSNAVTNGEGLRDLYNEVVACFTAPSVPVDPTAGGLLNGFESLLEQAGRDALPEANWFLPAPRGRTLGSPCDDTNGAARYFARLVREQFAAGNEREARESLTFLDSVRWAVRLAV
jgi:hypothetical protein